MILPKVLPRFYQRSCHDFTKILSRSYQGFQLEKVHRNDGLLIEFYKTFWDLIGDPLVASLEQLQNTPQLTPSFNLLLPWSAVRSWLYLLSVKLKCYRSRQSRSRWIRIKLSVKLKCYRGPQSRSRWLRNNPSVKLKCYRGPQSSSRWISIKLS